MPNYCNYDLRAVGTKKDLETFYKEFAADYQYDLDTGKLIRCEYEGEPVEHHLFRNWDVYPNLEDAIHEEWYPDGYFMEVAGYCAWSVYTCMFDGPHTYYADRPEGSKGTHLLEMSKRLSVDIEIFSEESGVGFAEHYLIKSGELIISEETNFEEYPAYEFNTKEECEEAYDIKISDDEWNNADDYIVRGGFDKEYNI